MLRDAARHHPRRPKAPSVRAGGTALTGEPGWLSTGSYRFSLLAGYSSPEVTDDTGGIHAGTPAAFGFQGALRFSLLRLSLSTLYRDGTIGEHGHHGIETGIGAGIQLWRAGLLSPYAEARFTTYASSSGELMSADLDDINGMDIVVGNTFTFVPLGYRHQDPARSRFFLDVSYTVHGRAISSEQLIFALGFDRAW